MAGRTVNSLGLAFVGVKVTQSADLFFENNYQDITVDIVETWPSCKSFALNPGEKMHPWTYYDAQGKPINKLWVRPRNCKKGFDTDEECPPIPQPGSPSYKHDCQADCLGCFYVAPNMNKDGRTLDVGIGFGVNTPVKNKYGVGELDLTYNDVTDHYKEKTIYCKEGDCDYQKIAVVHAGGERTVSIGGKNAVHGAASGAPLYFVNNAAHPVDVVATWPDCTHFHLDAKGGKHSDYTWNYHLTQGKKVNKLWVRPVNCTEKMGCPAIPVPGSPSYQHDCQADCLGCFYVAPNVAPNQATLDVGLGFGDNDKPVNNLGIGEINLDFQDAADHDKEKHIYCNTDQCQTKDIAVVHAGGPHTVTIEAKPTPHEIVEYV